MASSPPERQQLFIISVSNGKYSYSLNQAYQKELTNSLSNLIECTYNQYALSFGFSDINSLLTLLQDSLSEINLSLESLEKQTTQKILSAIEEISKISENLAEPSINLTPASVQVFTEINQEFKSRIEREAFFSEMRARKEKKLHILDLRIFQLKHKKELFSSSYPTKLEFFSKKIQNIEQNLSKIKELDKNSLVSKSFINSIADFTLPENCSTGIKNLDGFLDEISELHKSLESLKFEINYFPNNEDIERVAIEKYCTLDFERNIEPILIEDLRKLKKSKERAEKKIDKYTPVWLCKHFDKNLNLIRKDLNKIVNGLADIQITCQKNKDNMIHQVNLDRNEKIVLKKPTINNYKSKLITWPDQRKISESISLLFLNLEALNSSKNSMNVKHLNIYYSPCFLHPVCITECSVNNFKIKEKCKILIQKVQFLNQAMIEVLKSLNDFRLTVVEGFVSDNIKLNKKKHANPSTSSVISTENGKIDVILTRPNFRCYFFNLSLIFEDHEIFKQTKTTLHETLKNIEVVEKRLSFKDNLNSEIFAYEEHLKSLKIPEIPSIESNILQSTQFKDILKYTKSENIFINRENVNLILASIFSCLNLKKKSGIWSKKVKSYKNNSLTLKEFKKILQKVLIASDKTHENLNQGLSHYLQINSISSKELSNFLVNEEIVGSLLDENNQPQDLTSGKVSEEFYKSFTVIAKDFALISLFQKLSLKELRGKIGRLHELKELLKSYSLKYGKNFAEFVSSGR